MKIGAAYVRVSTDDQTEYSPDSQLKLIRDYAKRDGYVIPEEYVFQDDGISGKRADKRPQFQLMIATAKESPSPFETIFVWKYSRFARNQEESIVYKNMLKKNGVSVVSISEPSTDSPYSSLIESIISWMDEYYLLNLSQEVRRGMKEKASRGEAMGRPPFGYKVENKMLVPDDNAHVVKYIFDSYNSGKSYREISLDLVDYDLTGQAVRYILSNPSYIGKTRWDDTDHAHYRSNDYRPDVDKLPDGKHEPIIDLETWNKTQKRLSAKQTDVKYQRQGHPVFMLKGLARCGSCGATLVSITNHKRGERVRLQCNNYSKGKCKVSHFIYADVLDALVLDAMEQCVANNTFTFSPVQNRPQSRLRKDWNKLIAAERKRLERLKTAYLDGVIELEDYKSTKEDIESTISALKEKQKEDEPKPVKREEIKPVTMEVLSVLRSPDVSGEAKNKALRSIVEKVVFFKEYQRVAVFFTTPV